MATVTPFLEPRLTGSRFTGGVIPLEVLADLAALEELFVEVAKWKYRQQHPTRKRLPGGFTDGAVLTLTGIEEGSARPLIGLMLAAGTLLPTGAASYFDDARAAITQAIRAADHGGQVTTHLPQGLLTYFNRVGRHLRAGEALELPSADDGGPARLTPDSRRQLVLAATSDAGVSRAVVLYGSVTEVDLSAKTFHIQLLDGRRVKGRADDQQLGGLTEAIGGYQATRAKVAMVGTGRYNRTDVLENVDEVQHVFVLDPLDVHVRVHELKQLRTGWLDGEGDVPAPELLDRFAARFDAWYPADLPLPFVYPTESGGVRAEWSLPPHDVSLDIDLRADTGRWHDLDLDTGHEVTRNLDMAATDDWNWLADQLRAAAEKAG